ncbi:hypothetical protein HK100_008425, partial [Physocladia obscura]
MQRIQEKKDAKFVKEVNGNQRKQLIQQPIDNRVSPVPSIDSEALELAITSQNGNSSTLHNSTNQSTTNNQNNTTASLLSQSAPRANSGFPIPSAANYNANSSVPSLSRSASNGNLLGRNNNSTITTIAAANAAPSSRFGFLSGASTGNSTRK